MNSARRGWLLVSLFLIALQAGSRSCFSQQVQKAVSVTVTVLPNFSMTLSESRALRFSSQELADGTAKSVDLNVNSNLGPHWALAAYVSPDAEESGAPSLDSFSCSIEGRSGLSAPEAGFWGQALYTPHFSEFNAPDLPLRLKITPNSQAGTAPRFEPSTVHVVFIDTF